MDGESVGHLPWQTSTTHKPDIQVLNRIPVYAGERANNYLQQPEGNTPVYPQTGTEGGPLRCTLRSGPWSARHDLSLETGLRKMR